jgi:low affinity Fe/Cu permease
MKIGDMFSNLSRKSAQAAGSWQAFILAVAVVVVWCIGGFWVGFSSELYQLFINTLTTITTFVMVFLIQADQNRSTKALQLKIDDLLCSIREANSQLAEIEDATDEQIDQARREMSAAKDQT